MRTAEQLAQRFQASHRPNRPLSFNPTELALLAALDHALTKIERLERKQFAHHHRNLDE